MLWAETGGPIKKSRRRIEELLTSKRPPVRADWIVEEGSMLTAAQQAQTAVRKRRVMYVLILMVVVFMTSWFPLSAVNLIKDLEIPLVLEQMYFKLMNAHAIAMTSVVWNPLLYFWMSKGTTKFISKS
ncbi:unnamed protein product [Nippostrongylus brasiliensis]|uniref:G_PROTEIN_RECEP_F1_2 domain-containing protein n=1 Tax=Nippostrongylus brasiliensis TaxID=27835 RepID=A0A0N4XLQ6_NIPBR|nr:unnamed protein product [Nippostrongylus brasiliensis]